MKTLKFKTNIKCSGCVATVTNPLNAAVGEGKWNVDLTSPHKTLLVSNADALEKDIVSAIEKVGYKVEKID